MKLRGWGKGVNKDLPPWELEPGFWSDCSNIRFRSGRAIRVGGIATSLTPSITPYMLMPYSSGATRYVFYAGLTKAYVHDGSTETEITKKTHPTVQTISNATRSSSTLTVTTGGNHGLATGDIITTTGFNPTSYNKTNVTITVTGATTFTYTVTNAGASPATTMGAYSVVYSVNDTTSAFTATADTKWSGGNFNGVVYANSPNDGLFYWDQAVTGVMHTFPDATVTTQDAVRHFKNWMFLLAPTTSGTKYRHRVQWSQSADPGSIPTSFTAAATNDAGFYDLVSDGEVVDAKEYGDTFFIFKRDCRFAMRKIDGQYVFDQQLVSGNHKDDGCLAVGCIANTPKGQVYITDGHDVRIHVGGESQSIVQGRMQDYLRSNMDTTYRKRSFLLLNPPFNELWVCYPKTGSSTVSEALIWNWEDDSWGIRTLTNITAGGSGEYPTTISSAPCLLVANSTPKIGLVDSGNTDFGSTLASTLERTGLDFDDPSYKVIAYSIPLFDASTNFTASIYHGASATQDGTPTYSSAATYTHNTTQRVYAQHPAGKFLAYKISTTASDTPALVSIDFGKDGIKSLGQF